MTVQQLRKGTALKIESRLIIQSNSRMGHLIKTSPPSANSSCLGKHWNQKTYTVFSEFERNNGKEIPVCNERCRYSTIPRNMEISDQDIYQSWPSQTLKVCKTTRVWSTLTKYSLFPTSNPSIKFNRVHMIWIYRKCCLAIADSSFSVS